MRIEVWVWLNAWPRPSSYKTAGVGVVTETKLPGGVQTLAKMSRCQPEGPMLQVSCAAAQDRFGTVRECCQHCDKVQVSECLVLPKQVFCLRGVCVSYTLLLVLLLPELGLVARPRCGVELIADLEFVCGDRGFYRGRAIHTPRLYPDPVVHTLTQRDCKTADGRARNGGSRSRGNGIVEQCCIKGCDLQHLEQYCAKPSRGRRQAPAFPLPTREAQFQMLFLKQYQRFLELNPEKLAQRMQEQSLYLETLRNPTLLNSNEKISNPPVCL
ncbi:hypothetical protein P4O66_022715 [Electrophorus voltai]|uniref:Insulin-like domain-containing protein n=1 Tax=Electrophorus voltai TaxID=2609070 RepID=A0AAD9E218_9TELE|nr:hypothetical protein P4O66_022715 [Electrophorus voltai]